MKLALIGSRNYTDYDQFKAIINNTLAKWNKNMDDIEKVISGGTKGADTLAERWANENNIQHKMKVYLPDWTKNKKVAGILRNTDIINDCTHVIAFPSRLGKGIQDSINKAKKSNKVIEVIYID